MTLDWTDQLLDQLGFHWDGILRPRLDSLTDEAMHWEPVAGMWGVRPRTESRTSLAAGAADTVVDYELEPPQPTPMTTIAWRLAHLADVFGERAANHFGGAPFGYDTVDWPLTAAGMLAVLDRAHADWVEGVRGLDAAALAAPCGPSEGPYAAYPMATLVLHITREALHHGAEVALLMDLYAHRDTITTGGTR